MGHVGSKTRSLGQILEKVCVLSLGHIFSPIIMKLCQNVCLDAVPDDLEMGHVGSKTKANLRITVQKAQVSDYRAIMALLLYLILLPYYISGIVLTLSQITNFGLFQAERVCSRQFYI